MKTLNLLKSYYKKRHPRQKKINNNLSESNPKFRLEFTVALDELKIIKAIEFLWPLLAL